MILKTPVMIGDTVAGLSDGEETKVYARDVTTVELRKMSLWRSVAVVLAIPATLVAGMLIAMGAS